MEIKSGGDEEKIKDLSLRLQKYVKGRKEKKRKTL